LELGTDDHEPERAASERRTVLSKYGSSRFCRSSPESDELVGQVGVIKSLRKTGTDEPFRANSRSPLQAALCSSQRVHALPSVQPPAALLPGAAGTGLAEGETGQAETDWPPKVTG